MHLKMVSCSSDGMLFEYTYQMRFADLAPALRCQFLGRRYDLHVC